MLVDILALSVISIVLDSVPGVSPAIRRALGIDKDWEDQPPSANDDLVAPMMATVNDAAAPQMVPVVMD